MNTSRYNLVLSSHQKIYAGASVGDAKLTKEEKANLKTFEKIGFYGDKPKPRKAKQESQPKDESKDESKDDSKLSRADRLKANSQN